jgi:hypothetical protein
MGPRPAKPGERVSEFRVGGRAARVAAWGYVRGAV